MYAYSGDGTLIQNIVLLVDYYLDHSLSSPTAAWPNLAYPYDTAVRSGVYDGDMMGGATSSGPTRPLRSAHGEAPR